MIARIYRRGMQTSSAKGLASRAPLCSSGAAPRGRQGGGSVIMTNRLALRGWRRRAVRLRGVSLVSWPFELEDRKGQKERDRELRWWRRDTACAWKMGEGIFVTDTEIHCGRE